VRSTFVESKAAVVVVVVRRRGESKEVRGEWGMGKARRKINGSNRNEMMEEVERKREEKEKQQQARFYSS
jgi:hypothetical protein